MKNWHRPQPLTLAVIALTFGSGATDVACFTRVGGVFASVMTGNIVLWGLAAAHGSLSLFSHATVSLAGYVVGVIAGTRIAYGLRAKKGEGGVWPEHVTWALRAELVLLAGFTVGWEVSGGRPAGWAQYCLLAAAAAAMGVQAAAARDMGLAEVTTTYLTGTLTALVSSLARPGLETPHRARRFSVLFGLAAGASLSGLLIATAADAMPTLPLAGVVTALVLADRNRPSRS
ncbi:MAG: YoaK family protein [Streptosporangiaceae bacterium]